MTTYENKLFCAVEMDALLLSFLIINVNKLMLKLATCVTYVGICCQLPIVKYDFLRAVRITCPMIARTVLQWRYMTSYSL